MKLFKSKTDASTEDSSKSEGLFSRLTKTRQGLAGGIRALFSAGVKIDEDFLDEIQDQLIMSDLGVNASQKIVDELRQTIKAKGISDEQECLDVVRAAIKNILNVDQTNETIETYGSDERPFVVMMVGVNGVGKTTTCAKLGAQAQSSGKKVMFAACDTFRAAAIEQLQSWGNRLDIPVIAQQHGADAAAVAFDAFNAACSRKTDLLLIDTAGRQHTHGDLMEQLKKVSRVLKKADESIPDQVWLTVDAGNGQNVISQVDHFNSAVGLDGICVTKLDGTAKGGVMVALAEKFEVPIKYIGVGEGVDDLRPFDAEEFVQALIPDRSHAAS